MNFPLTFKTCFQTKQISKVKFLIILLLQKKEQKIIVINEIISDQTHVKHFSLQTPKVSIYSNKQNFSEIDKKLLFFLVLVYCYISSSKRLVV